MKVLFLLGLLLVSGCKKDSRTEVDPCVQSGGESNKIHLMGGLADAELGEQAYNRREIGESLGANELVIVDGYESSSGIIYDTIADEEYGKHVDGLKKKIPKGFHVVIQKPFVIIGNQSKAQMNRHAKRTVKWAVERLKSMYFVNDPRGIIDVWLFGDGWSYRHYSKELFGHTPDTPYGYFSETDRAMVMNISTGAGTLVHELVHPFISANFPHCPTWLNEGLASLYEHSSGKNGTIWGLTNWRLKGLQQAIRSNSLPSFESLMASTADEFYNMDPGSNYAQSRYLLQFLQERKLLKSYFHSVVANQKIDPTGYNTLKAVLDEDDMETFQSKWEKWVMRL